MHCTITIEDIEFLKDKKEKFCILASILFGSEKENELAKLDSAFDLRFHEVKQFRSIIIVLNYFLEACQSFPRNLGKRFASCCVLLSAL